MNTMNKNIAMRIYPAPLFVTGSHYIRLSGTCFAQSGAGSKIYKLALLAN